MESLGLEDEQYQRLSLMRGLFIRNVLDFVSDDWEKRGTVVPLQTTLGDELLEGGEDVDQELIIKEKQ